MFALALRNYKSKYIMDMSPTRSDCIIYLRNHIEIYYIIAVLLVEIIGKYIL